MPIVSKVKPKGGQRVVHAALSRRIGRGSHLPSLQGEPKTGASLPVYRISARGASRAKPLALARRVGWQYPVIGGDRPGLACLRECRSGLRYAGLIEGALPQRLLDAALVAEAHLAGDTRTYQARLLHIPALQIQALWLYVPHGPNLFVTLTEARRAHEQTPVNDIRQLIRRVRADLKSRTLARRAAS